MNAPKIETSVRAVPMIYAYTTPGVSYHDGWTKIGYTEKNVEARIREQTHVSDIRWSLEWKGNAVFDDGTGATFRDTDFHAYLRADGVEQESGKRNEWFHITGPASRAKFNDFRADSGVLRSSVAVVPYALRDEQSDAVRLAKEVFDGAVKARTPGAAPAVLWNAKPRFGKTLAVYDLAKKIGAKTVLVVTNRPAVAASWLDDYNRFLGEGSGFLFVSETDAVAGKRGVYSRQRFVDAHAPESGKRCIEFVSLQDLKGAIDFGGKYDKLREVSELIWDLLVIDEAHEGVDTYRTDAALERVKRRAELHLSGTPFKALAGGKFPAGAVFNWTYADEQRRKADWDAGPEGAENPYADLPRLSLYTYRLSDMALEKARRGAEINGEREDWAFDLNEFFATDGNGRFRHDAEVDRFLDSLAGAVRFPFSTPELRDKLRHTFWLMGRVDGAKTLARKLAAHPVFKDYEVVLVAGDCRLGGEGAGDGEAVDDQAANGVALDRVRKAIATHDKTITLSVGRLTTGVTVPEWTAVLMLCSLKSPALYMQAAFRAQNPCLWREPDGTLRRKTDAYVFDFDPARTLVVYEQFANDLVAATANGRGTADARRRNVGELLNFFPVIGEDEKGELVELDAERVLSIPRRIKCEEVVRRGFMSNFLFRNIAAVFAAPREIMGILEKCHAAKEGEGAAAVAAAANSLSLDEDGRVAIAPDWVNGKAGELFGDKIFDAGDLVKTATDSGFVTCGENESATYDSKPLETAVRSEIVVPIVTAVKATYGDKLTTADARNLERALSADAGRAVAKAVDDENIRVRALERDRKEALEKQAESGRSAGEINREFDELLKREGEAAKERIAAAVAEIVESGRLETVRRAETRVQERERDDAMDKVREHLRGFARTIPSFLMAYGDGNTALANFDTVIPDNVFLEVTGITAKEFRLLRDGGTLIDGRTGAERQFDGGLFEPVVFDDSVKEFLAKKDALSNWFDENAREDIFDYIPPQKTNQIFTPRAVVLRMVDALERENPGCFDDPEKTFADLYVKSGLFLSEIVKRLYRSPALKNAYPERRDRLAHIFGKQIYGLAPTEIIWRIARNYLLGFDKGAESLPNNIRHFDTLPAAKAGTLSSELDAIFPDRT